MRNITFCIFGIFGAWVEFKCLFIESTLCRKRILYIEENLLNTINIWFMFANEKAPSEAETIIIKIAKRTKQIISTGCLFMTSHTVNYSNICALFSLLICIKQYALLHTHIHIHIPIHTQSILWVCHLE